MYRVRGGVGWGWGAYPKTRCQNADGQRWGETEPRLGSADSQGLQETGLGAMQCLNCTQD